MHTVLFVCTGNQYRSPIAAATFLDQLMQACLDEDWIVKSAGTEALPGQDPPAEAVDLALLLGLLIDEHKTQALTTDLLAEADLVLVMEESHRDVLKAEFPFARQKIHLLTEVLKGVAYDIPDPAAANGDLDSIISEMVGMIRAGYMKIYNFARAG